MLRHSKWAGIPPTNVESIAILYSRYLDGAKEYCGSFEELWIPQGPDFLALKLCYD